MIEPVGKNGKQTSALVPLAAFIALSLFIVLVGRFVYDSEMSTIKAAAHQQLAAVGDLKVRQIGTWMAERRADAQAVTGDPFLTLAVAQRAAGGEDGTRAGELIRAWLEDMKTNFEYRSAALANPTGAVEVSTNGMKMAASDRLLALQAIANRSPVISSPHRHEENGASFLDIDLFAPLINTRDPAQPVIGVINLTVDVRKSLFPLIQSWPTPSPTAETLLVERIGDRIVFLNDLRHRQGTATVLTESVDTETLPAAQAVRGVMGLVEGLDYRHVPVLAATRKIPETSWHIVAKVDKSEVYAPIHRLAVVVSLVTGLFVSFSAVPVGLWWRQNRRRIDLLERSYRDEIERRSLSRHVEYLAKYANDIIILVDAEGKIANANDRAATAYGYSTDELLGMPFILLFAEEARTGRGIDAGTTIDTLLETVHRRRDGSTFPVEISMRVFAIDNTTFSQIIGRDITERRNAETHLRLAAKVFDDSTEAIVITDASNTIVSVNTAFTELTGFTPGEVIGRNPRIFKTGVEDDAFYIDMWRSIMERGRWRGEISALRKNGEVFPKWMSISAVRNERGEIVNFIGIFSDISALKQAEERLKEANATLERKVEERTMELAQAVDRAEDAARAKSEFLAVMSHEIRTPMNGVLGMVRLLQDTTLDPRQRDYAETIQYSAEALLTILNDILDFSKLEAGRMELEAVPMDLERLVVSVATLMGSRAHEKGLTLRTHLGDDLPRHIRGDPTRLRQVLINLVGNGIKFTETGGVTIAVESTSREAGRDTDRVALRFAVIDTGIGIPDHARNRLFARFSQVDASISRQYGGTGLGLYICRQIVELMGGTIDVDSVPGQGSTFWFTAVCDIAEDVDKVEAPAGATGTALPLAILLAEDNVVNQKVALGMLGKRGHRVTVAADGAAALAAVQAGTFDIVLMDMQMPGMDGLEAT
ncbi:MAG: PAS domain S-box protein, partial [Alphaproteobacteria bacterium]